MPDEPMYVTRREFYLAIGMLFNMVGILALGLSRMREDLLYSIGMLILALGAILSALGYIVAGLRAKAKPVGSGPGDTPPSSRGPD